MIAAMPSISAMRRRRGLASATRQSDEALAQHFVALRLRARGVLRPDIADGAAAFALARQDEAAHEARLRLLRGRRKHRRYAALEPRLARPVAMRDAVALDANAAFEAIAQSRPLMDMRVGDATFGEADHIAAHQPFEAIIERHVDRELLLRLRARRCTQERALGVGARELEAEDARARGAGQQRDRGIAQPSRARALMHRAARPLDRELALGHI